MPEVYMWWAIALPVVGAVVFAIAIYQLYRLLRFALRFLLKGADFGNLSGLAILLSFAIAALIMQAGARDIWGLAYGLLKVSFVEFPRAAVELGYGSYSCTSFAGDAALCLFQVARNGATSVGQFFNDTLRYFDDVVALAQFFALWAVLAWIAGDILDRTQTQTAPKGLRLVFAQMSDESRQRLALGSIIAVGAYLCLCAIVAVSLFKPVEKPQQLDKQTLENQLRDTKLATTGDKSPFSVRFPLAFEAIATTTGDASPLATGYAELQTQWVQVRAQVEAEQDRLVHRAVASYVVENLNRVGSREQANHYLALSRWYQSALSRLYGSLDRCRASIVRLRWTATSSVTRSALPQPNVSSSLGGGPSGQQSQESTSASRAEVTDMTSKLAGGVKSLPDISLLGSNDPIGAARASCEWQTYETAEPPDRSDFGLSLGVMGTLSQWLLRTESMPLALITGLVGFGLFGALVSTYIRVTPGAAVQIDTFGVVCRGLSAAIVVFLAAYGGIAIVSQSGSDPNPYLVFVTCMVGAVFGDDVWTWAKTKFLPKADEAENAAHAGEQRREPQQAEQH
jgi:hypothetical protein